MISLFAMTIAFIWTMLPLMGWNEYTLEVSIECIDQYSIENFFQGARTSCCINWVDHRPSYVSFLIFLFVVVYLIPLGILFTSNTITLIGLKRMREKIKNGIQTVLNRKRIEMEQRILKSKLFSLSVLSMIILV